MTWFACDAELARDKKIVELLDVHGPKGGWAWVCLMAEAKLHGSAGTVDLSLRRFSADAHLDDSDEAEAILRKLEELGVVALQDITSATATVRLEKWAKYQQDALNQRRVARSRNKTITEPSPSVTKALPTGTRTRTVKDKGLPQVENLCSLLASLVEANGRPRHLVNWPSEAWRKDCRLMLESDKRPVDEIEQLIRWCQADAFWRSNVLSMPKFRAQYDQLRLKAGPAQRDDDGFLERLNARSAA